MGLIVQKYGGTSLADLDHIKQVAQKIIHTHEAQNQVVVVLSAMGQQTDHLIALAHQITDAPALREYDLLVSTGEQISVALMAIMLHHLGYRACSYTGLQLGILTDGQHSKAKILSVQTQQIKKDLQSGCIPIIAGFQGHDQDQNITTLGRGGSDITAVAIAAALHADECQVYTDVQGIYTADPHMVPDARLLDKIRFEEILELSSLGTKVLQSRSVELAGKYHVPIRVLSAFNQGAGTLITYEDFTVEQPIISGIAYDQHQAQLRVLGIQNTPGHMALIFQAMQDANLTVDMIVQSPAHDDGQVDVSFTVSREEYKQAKALLHQLSKTVLASRVTGNDHVVKLSVVGMGMRTHIGVATTLFQALAKAGIPMLLVATSEIKISVLIDEAHGALGLRTLHAAFELG